MQKSHTDQADVIGNAVHVMKMATGEIEESEVQVGNAVRVMKVATGEMEESGAQIGKAVRGMKLATIEIEKSGAQTEVRKDKAAVHLGRKGGLARAKKTTKADRIRIARKAAATRWKVKR